MKVFNIARNLCALLTADLLGEAIKRTATESRVSSLFD
jgi:hypothetical protein